MRLSKVKVLVNHRFLAPVWAGLSSWSYLLPTTCAVLDSTAGLFFKLLVKNRIATTESTI